MPERATGETTEPTQPAGGGDRRPGRDRIGLVAAVTGLLGAVLAVLVPLLPVTQTTSEISWPQQGTTDPVTAPLVAYYPLDFSVDVPCSAVAELRSAGPDDGMLVSTAPKEAGQQAGARGLTIGVAGPNVEVRNRNELIASAPADVIARPGGCDRIHVEGTATHLHAEFAGITGGGDRTAGDVEGRDLRPQVVGVFTDLTGPAPAGLDVHVTVDTRYSTEATALKKIAVALGVVATLASLVALHRLDLRDRRRARRLFAPGWWKPRPLDLLVLGALLLWHVIGANTSDDGYILTQSRAVETSGYVPEVFRYYGASYAPFGMPFYVFTALSHLSLGSVWLRIPSLLLGIGTWFLLSREVVPRLGRVARTAPAVRWTCAAMFLAFWLTFNNGLRPEPIIAFGVLATWVSLERALATGRLLPAAVGFILGGLTISAAPTGSFCIAAILAASRPLLLLVYRRARRQGWLATLGPLAAAGLSALFLLFWDQPLKTVLQSSAMLGRVGPAGTWYEETWRYEWLMNPTPDGSLARRFAVVAMLLALVTCAAVLLRRGRIAGVPAGPSRRLVGLGFISIAFMMFNPTKWTHHFGAFASIGASLAALATLAVLPAATRSLRNRVLFCAAVAFVLAVSFEAPNGWWYISIYGIPWGGTPPSISGIRLASMFLALLGVFLVLALLLHYREAFAADRGRLRWRPHGRIARLVQEVVHAPLGLAASLVVLIMVASMLAAVRNQYPAYSVGLQNARALAGHPCGIADSVLAEPDPTAGLLQPVTAATGPQRPSRDQLVAGGESLEVSPDGIPTDLTATQGEASASVGTGSGSDTTSSTAGTGGGTRGSEGVNGSHARLPFGLDPARTPVIGTNRTGAQRNAEATSAWYSLGARDAAQPILAIAAAGEFAPDAVRVEYTNGQGSDAPVTGSTIPLDIGPAPSWRNLRVPLDRIPGDATAVRLVVSDHDPDPDRWVAVTPPRLPRLTTMQEYIGDRVPVLADWAVAFHTPCLRSFQEYAGIAQIPQFRIMADRGLTIAAGNTWEGWDGGGPLGFTELLQHGETVPTYLDRDWDRDWGSVEKLTPLVPAARPAEVTHGEQVRSGLWDGGPLAR